MTDEQFGGKMADKDLREIAAADCLILDLEKPSLTMGKMVEFGFAIAMHKLLYVVAPEGTMSKGHIFLRKADQVFNNWEDLLTFFKEAHKV